MGDLLIRNVDDADIRRIDALATRMGLSRAELLRRHAQSLARRQSTPVTLEDLKRSAEAFADVLDDEVMSKAW